jgi:heme-degrading monooxygenase HmoA
MILCLRTVDVPGPERDRYLAWIAEGRAIREAHGILAELVLEPSADDGPTVVVTIWPSHEVFDAWIATPERDDLTSSAVHQAVDYHPITRYDIAGGYLNQPGLADQPDQYPSTEATP